MCKGDNLATQLKFLKLKRQQSLNDLPTRTQSALVKLPNKLSTLPITSILSQRANDTSTNTFFNYK